LIHTYLRRNQRNNAVKQGFSNLPICDPLKYKHLRDPLPHLCRSARFSSTPRCRSLSGCAVTAVVKINVTSLHIQRAMKCFFRLKGTKRIREMFRRLYLYFPKSPKLKFTCQNCACIQLGDPITADHDPQCEKQCSNGYCVHIQHIYCFISC
jgi:hypothetical protein